MVEFAAFVAEYKHLLRWLPYALIALWWVTYVFRWPFTWGEVTGLAVVVALIATIFGGLLILAFGSEWFWAGSTAVVVIILGWQGYADFRDPPNKERWRSGRK